MFGHADIVISETDPPINGLCASGHKAPETFRREGPDSPELPTRFFHVHTPTLSGIYCEPCLIIANHTARLKKQGLM